MNIYVDLNTGLVVSNAAAAMLPNVEVRTVTNAEFEALLEAKRIAEMTQSEHFKAIEHALEQHMDAVAQADGWDDRKTCALRAGYAGPWQQKGIKFAQWMDNCWAYVIQEQSKVAAGTRAMPIPAQAIAELPAMVW